MLADAALIEGNILITRLSVMTEIFPPKSRTQTVCDIHEKCGAKQSERLPAKSAPRTRLRDAGDLHLVTFAYCTRKYLTGPA